MSTLVEVCVWITPFPPSGVIVEDAGSSNVVYTTSCQTDVQNNLMEPNNIQVYPNPANDKVTIITNKLGLIKITDINGRIIISKNIEAVKAIIDISEISGGVYSIQIMTDKGMTVKKLVKQ